MVRGKKSFALAVLVFASVFPLCAHADRGTQEAIDRALAICDHELADSTSGAYQSYQLSTVQSILTTLRQHVESARVSEPESPAVPALAALEGEIDRECADAVSGRWSSYSVSTMAQIMRRYHDELTEARSQDGTWVSPVVDALDQALAICDHEISDATSGAYSNYNLSTVQSILTNLRGLVERASHHARLQATFELLRALTSQLDAEYADAVSGHWQSYSVQTVARIMQTYRSQLLSARNLEGRR